MDDDGETVDVSVRVRRPYVDFLVKYVGVPAPGTAPLVENSAEAIALLKKFCNLEDSKTGDTWLLPDQLERLRSGLLLDLNGKVLLDQDEFKTPRQLIYHKEISSLVALQIRDCFNAANITKTIPIVYYNGSKFVHLTQSPTGGAWARAKDAVLSTIRTKAQAPFASSAIRVALKSGVLTPAVLPDGVTFVSDVRVILGCTIELYHTAGLPIDVTRLLAIFNGKNFNAIEETLYKNAKKVIAPATPAGTGELKRNVIEASPSSWQPRMDRYVNNQKSWSDWSSSILTKDRISELSQRFMLLQLQQQQEIE